MGYGTMGIRPPGMKDIEENPMPIVGEIIGHRVWWADNMPSRNGWVLRSVYLYSIWEPQVPMIGEPRWYGNGVHAWKTKELMDKYAFDLQAIGRIYVKGTVELWGLVDEYDYGYRAERAYPLTLDEVFLGTGTDWDWGRQELIPAPTSYPEGLLPILRTRYLS